jgi:hypothetical protein
LPLEFSKLLRFFVEGQALEFATFCEFASDGQAIFQLQFASEGRAIFQDIFRGLFAARK